MDIVIAVWLCRKPNMMCYVLVFYGDDGKAIRETTEEILVTRNSKDFGGVVEIYKGVGDDLEKQEHV